MNNIRSFLTTDTTDYYHHVIRIIKDLEDISGVSIAIFDGAVRDLVRNKIPRDVDIWFQDVDVDAEMWKQMIWNMVHNLTGKHTVSDLRSHPMSDDHYEISTITIDSIDFDFCCNINGRISFNTLCDFSVNNLYILTDGEIRTRVQTKYTVHDILEHIKDWKLIDTNDMEVINSI